nr:MmgE/PrpD family protein [Desulfobacterales bacterium]
MLSILKRRDIDPDNVGEIEIVVPEHVFEIVGKPFEIRDNPSVDGQFSLQYKVGAALIRKNISLQDFEEEAVRDPNVMNLA